MPKTYNEEMYVKKPLEKHPTLALLLKRKKREKSWQVNFGVGRLFFIERTTYMSLILDVPLNA